MMLESLARKLAIHMREIPNRNTGDPYLTRYYLAGKMEAPYVALHQFHDSDDDGALHDHPWPMLSLVLKGRYTEHTIKGPVVRRVGSLKVRGCKSFHSVEIDPKHAGNVWTLCVMGPRLHEWGFLNEEGPWYVGEPRGFWRRKWVPWWRYLKEYVK